MRTTSTLRRSIASITLALYALTLSGAAAACDLPIKIHPGAYAGADEDALRFYTEALAQNDQATMNRHKTRGMVWAVPAGSTACALRPANAFSRMEVRLPDGQTGWMNDDQVTKVGWGGRR